MMWYHLLIFFSLSSSAALRVNEAAARVEENEGGVKENVNKFEVRIALSLTEPFAQTGSPIEFAVNGVRRLTRISETYPGRSVVLQHIRRGHVVTAYVDAVEDACAYWVGGGVEHCTVGGWNLSFAISDESESVPLYDAYVSLMGMGKPVTMKVNHTVVAVYAAQPNQLLVYPGLQKGTEVQAIGPLGDNCTYNVGNENFKCSLNETWGLAMGSVQSYLHAEDEGVHEDGKTKNSSEVEKTNYTVELVLAPEKIGYFKMIEIELNGHGIARKMSATEEGKHIVVYHVKRGSVLTAVSHLTGKACSIYIVAGMQNDTCAGWKLNLNIKEENENTFADGKLFDTIFSVQRWSREQHDVWKMWKITANDVELASSAEPHVAPITWGGWPENTRIVPWVDDLESEADKCAHVVGQNATSCTFGGWWFSMHSQLNMNSMVNEHHWDWEVDHTSDSELDDFYEGDTFGFSVNATDLSGSKSRLECVAREYLELEMVEFDDVDTSPDDQKSRKILKGNFLFKPKELVLKGKKPRGMSVQAMTLSAYFRGTYDATKNDGFICTVYNDEWEVLCTADTNGMSNTYAHGCTLKIEDLD